MSGWKTIVVGVDGSAGSRNALKWAAAEAAEHGADLVVMNVWEHTLLPPAGSVSVSLILPEPLAVLPVAPPEATLVQVAALMLAANMSVNDVAVAVLGPVLLTVIVYVVV